MSVYVIQVTQHHEDMSTWMLEDCDNLGHSIAFLDMLCEQQVLLNKLV